MNSLKEKIAERIIERMQQDALFWQKGWNSLGGLAFNPSSSTKYGPVNQVLLSMSGFSDPRFMTFKQANSMGYRVKAGSKGTAIIYGASKQRNERSRTDEEVASVDNAKTGYFIVQHHVFNAEQIDGIAPLLKPELEFDVPVIVSNLYSNWLKDGGPTLQKDGRDPYYSPFKDLVVMPPESRFHSQQEYLAALTHEFAHATGHESRLNRKHGMTSRFGNEAYAKEELTAEFASAFLCAELGLVPGEDHIRQHAAYIDSWTKAIKDDVNVLFHAIKEAQQASEYLEKYITQIDPDCAPVCTAKPVFGATLNV